MAFISKTPKHPPLYKSVLRELGRVGPGSYDPYRAGSNCRGNSSEYLFNSKIERMLNFREGKTSEMLGPGCY
jgi:hypothetical protein